jgi:AcrR family transcriptional regulator
MPRAEKPVPVHPFRGIRRDPKARERIPLTVERIVDAAFEIMAKEGFEAVSMRRLAQQLGTGPASLYAHLSGKQELDALIIDRMASEVQIPDPDPQHWQDQVAQVLRDVRAAMLRHPGVARAVIANVPTGGDAMLVSDRLMGLLLSAGIDRQVAAWACDLLPLYVTAVAYEESVYLERGGSEISRDELVDQLRTYFRSLPQQTFPHLVASAVELTSGSGDERFEFGIRVILAGIAAVSADTAAGRPLP